MEIVIDSNLDEASAKAQNPGSLCPEEILKKQALFSVQYYSFDGNIHQGQMVMDKSLQGDIEVLFKEIVKHKFPIESVIPISHQKFHWDDERSMLANNTSGFNYRLIWGTQTLSNHAFGRAFDLNPRLNPWIKVDYVEPPGATHDLSKPGTIGANHFIVRFLKERGWKWGGDWIETKDYQHFEM